jgi:hypothetical protein
MTLKIRPVRLSGSADEILRELAAGEEIHPDDMASLLLELAVRERQEWLRRFTDAAAAVDGRSPK